MMKGQVTLRIMIAALVVIVLSCLSLVIVATGPTAHLTTVSTQNVSLFYPSELGLPRQAAAADEIYSLAKRRVLSGATNTQFQISLSEKPSVNDAPLGMIISGLGAPGTLFLNAIVVAQSKAQTVPSLSRGGYWLSAQLPSDTLTAQQARLDLILDQKDAWGIGIAGIKIGSRDDIARATKGVELVQQHRTIVFGVVGALGLCYSFFCLAIARTLWAGVSGLVFSTVVLSWCLIHPFNLGSVAIFGGRFAYLFAGVAALLAASQFSARLGGVWLGLGVCSVVGGIGVLFGWQSGLSFDLIATFSEIAPIALCGLGLPICVGATATQLVKERAEARAEAIRQADIVAAQSQELERQADREAVTQERKRFARDIHDGIGGQLVSLLWRVRAEPIPQEELAAEIEQGLADLRLVVDALDEGPVSLPIALANFSYRARAQLCAADIAFEWDLPRDLDIYWSDSRQILSLYRILQETVSNVMRHAGAKNLSIRFLGSSSEDPGMLRVTIEDDGRGFDPATTATGRGLANMGTRARQIGGTVTVTSPILPRAAPTSGTRIEIILPSRIDGA